MTDGYNGLRGIPALHILYIADKHPADHTMSKRRSTKAGESGHSQSSKATNSPQGANRDEHKRRSLSIIWLWTIQSRQVEGIRREIARQKGVSGIDIDLLSRQIRIEYDPDQIALEEIRAIVDGPSRRSNIRNRESDRHHVFN